MQKKTELLNFSTRFLQTNGSSVTLDSFPLTFSTESSILGLKIDDKLNFRLHINFITNKISKASGILYRIRDSLTSQARINYYYAFIYPFLTYCVLIWGGTYRTHLQPLIVQHKRAIRTIMQCNRIKHTSPLFFNMVARTVELLGRFLF